jgi:hypothetical protein
MPMAIGVIGRPKVEYVVTNVLGSRLLPRDASGAKKAEPIQEGVHIGLDRGGATVGGNKLLQIRADGLDHTAIWSVQAVVRISGRALSNLITPLYCHR